MATNKPRSEKSNRPPIQSNENEACYISREHFREWIEMRVTVRLLAAIAALAIVGGGIFWWNVDVVVARVVGARMTKSVEEIVREAAPDAIQSALIDKKLLETMLAESDVLKITLVDFSKGEFIRRYEESLNPAIRRSAIQQMGLIAPNDVTVRDILLTNATDDKVDVATRAVALRLYHPDQTNKNDAVLQRVLSSLPTDQELRVYKDLHAAYVECLSRFPVTVVSDMERWLKDISKQPVTEFPRRPRVVAYALARMNLDASLTALARLIDHEDPQIADIGLAGLTQLDPVRLPSESIRSRLLAQCEIQLSNWSKRRRRIEFLFGPVTGSEPDDTRTGPESVDMGFKHFVNAQDGTKREVLLKWPVNHGDIAAHFTDYDTTPFFALLRNDDGERFYQLLPASLESPEDVIVTSTLLHAWIQRLQRFNKGEAEIVAHSDELLQRMLQYDECFYLPATTYAISYAIRHASATQTNAFLRSFVEKHNYRRIGEEIRTLSFIDDEGKNVPESFATNLISADTLRVAVAKDAQATPPFGGVDELVADFLRTCFKNQVS